MLTIIYIDGKPTVAIRFKPDAAELIAEVNQGVSSYVVTLARLNHDPESIAYSIYGTFFHHPAVLVLDTRGPFPTDRPHHRIDENGLTPIPIQVVGEEMLEVD